MSDCVVTGIIRDVTGTPVSGVRVKISKTLHADLTTQAKERPVGESGVGGVIFRVVDASITAAEGFIAPQGAAVTVVGKFYVNGVSFVSGVALTIPASGTATINSLVAAATFPTQGAVVKSNGTALAGLFGTFDFSSDFTVTQSPTSEANIGLAAALIVTTEQVQDALTAFFPDVPPYDFTYNDAGNAVGLVIAPATTSVNGLMSAADKAIINALGATYAPIVHTHIAAQITDFAAAVLLVAPAPAWGSITGTLSAQTDLQTALNLKADASHVHTFASLTSKPTTLAGYGIADAQGLNTNLSAIAALADAAGYLHNDGAGVFAYQEIDLSSILTTSISNGDLTHAPDGNSVFDALALKADSASLAAVALSGSASDLSAGTIPDARFPATLPALSGANLTALNAGNISSGILATARGGFGTDMSAAAGVSLWAAGVPTLTGTSGTGNFARVTSPTFVTPVLGAASATSLTTSGGIVVGMPTAPSAFQVRVTDGTNLHIDISGNTPGILLSSGTPVKWSNSATDATGSGDTTVSRNAAGIVQIGTSATNALGSLLAVGATFSGTVTSATFKSSTALVTSVDGSSNPTLLVNSIASTGGPTTAAQNGWLKFQDSGGATCWVPVWK